MSRLDDLVRFYSLLDRLGHKVGGAKLLSECSGRMAWPKRGVYFFFEDGESRLESGQGPRIVRVGTHALTDGSKSTLWGRLSQHRGNASKGSGNHRGSIFRLLVGSSLKAAQTMDEPRSWGLGSDPGQAATQLGLSRDEVKASELELESTVSQIIGRMPFLWLDIDDPPSGSSLRGRIERNAIALLSNLNKPALDAASPAWLGHHSDRPKVRGSGLWNNNHVDEEYNPSFLIDIEALITKMDKRNLICPSISEI